MLRRSEGGRGRTKRRKASERGEYHVHQLGEGGGGGGGGGWGGGGVGGGGWVGGGGGGGGVGGGGVWGGGGGVGGGGQVPERRSHAKTNGESL